MDDQSEVGSVHEDAKQEVEVELENRDYYLSEDVKDEFTEVTKRKRNRICTAPK